MKQINNVILIEICNNSKLLIIYFDCILNMKHIYIYIYIQTEYVNNIINQYNYTQTYHVNNKTNK